MAKAKGSSTATAIRNKAKKAGFPVTIPLPMLEG